MANLRVTTLVVSSKFRDIADDEQDRVIGGDSPSVEATQVATFINGKYASGINFAYLGPNANGVTVEQVICP
jgi:hypothetical protein